MKDRLIHFFFFNCRQATLLIERQQKKPLVWLNSYKLKVHLKVCKSCKKYELQSQLLEKLLGQNHVNSDDTNVYKLSEDIKTKMIQTIQDTINKD